MIRPAVLVGVFASLAAATIVVPASAAAASFGDCYGNPGSNGMACLSILTDGGFVTGFRAGLTKNHANTCSVPTVVITLLTDEPVEPRSTTVVGPKTCAARDFEWKHDGLTSRWILPQFCLKWSGFPDTGVCVKVD